ncbi:hypothetical protein ACLOJK_005439 [Asimina triloba]
MGEGSGEGLVLACTPWRTKPMPSTFLDFFFLLLNSSVIKSVDLLAFFLNPSAVGLSPSYFFFPNPKRLSPCWASIEDLILASIQIGPTMVFPARPPSPCHSSILTSILILVPP